MKVAVIGLRGFPLIEGGVEKHSESLYPRMRDDVDITVFRRKPYVCSDKVYPNISFVDEVFDILKCQGIIARKYFYPLTNSFGCYSDLVTAGAYKTPTAYSVLSMVYFSPTTWSNLFSVKNASIHTLNRSMKPKYVIEGYREFLFSKLEKPMCNATKRIFIVRGNDKVTRLVNEDVLYSVAEKYGFVRYEPGVDSILEQVRMFHDAEFIIAASGAALVNLMWCSKGCHVLCISPKKWKDYNYSTVAFLAGANFTCVDGKMIDDIRHSVDPRLFEKIIRDTLGITK